MSSMDVETLLSSLDDSNGTGNTSNDDDGDDDDEIATQHYMRFAGVGR